MNSVGAATTITGRRQANEDAYFMEPRWGLYVVADGMGGHHGGNVASETAIAAIEEFFRANDEDDCVTWPFGIRPDLTFAQNLVRVAVRAANHAIVSKRAGLFANMGSTIAVLALREGRAIIAHLGDSRVYRIRDGEVTQLTQDHSLYNQLTKAGAGDLGPPDEFMYRNVITRALGFTTSEGEEPEITIDKPRPGDVYLLCTDGLYEKLDEGVIVGVIGASKSLDAASAKLVELAYDRGSTDNITAVLARVD